MAVTIAGVVTAAGEGVPSLAGERRWLMRMFESGCAGFAQTNRPANGEPVRFYAVSQEVNLTPIVGKEQIQKVVCYRGAIALAARDQTTLRARVLGISPYTSDVEL